MLTMEERRKREETSLRTRRNARPAVCNRVTNRRTEDDVTYTTSGPGLILPLLYPEGMKPSAVLRAVRREAERLGVSLMPVEMGAGTYNGAGALRGKELPSALQAVGEWDDVLALSRHWAFHDYGTHNGPSLPMSGRAPRGSQDRRDDFAPVPKNVAETVARNLRERFRSRDEREAREARAQLAPFLTRKSARRDVHPGDAGAVAEGRARAFLFTAECGATFFADGEPSQERVDSLFRLLTRYFAKHGRAPESERELYGM